MDEADVQAMEDALDLEWAEMVTNLESAGFDLDDKAQAVWETGSIFLKNFLVSRGQLYSPKWPEQEPGTSRCSATVLRRVQEFQEQNHGWCGSFEVQPGGGARGDRSNDQGNISHTRRDLRNLRVTR